MEVDNLDEMIQLLLDEHYYVFTGIVVAIAFVWKCKPWRRQQKHNDRAASHGESKETESLQSKGKRTLLRGHLRNELDILQSEKEELEVLVMQLRTEMEWKDLQLSEATSKILAAAKYKPLGVSTRLAREFETLGTCWTLLVFGLCLINSKRRTRNMKRDRYPIQRTITTARECSSFLDEYTRHVAFPILSKNATIAAKEVHAHVTSNETVIGRGVARAFESIEEVASEKIVPVVIHIKNLFTQNAQLLVSAILAVELPGAKEKDGLLNMIEGLEQQISELEESLLKEEKSKRALELKLERLDGALEGKEALLYDERMKTRTWKLKYAEVKLEWEEVRQNEAQKQEEIAIAAVAENQKRLLHALLDEHIRCRRQEQEMRLFVAASNKNNMFLPVPIVQGISAAIYNNSDRDRSSKNKYELNLDNLRELYSKYSTPSGRETKFSQKGLGTDYEIVSRDDATDTRDNFHTGSQNEEQDQRDESNEGYSVLNTVRERIVQSKSTSQATWLVTDNSKKQPLLSPFLVAANSVDKRIENPAIRSLITGHGRATNSEEVKQSSWTEISTRIGMPTNE